MRALGDSKTPLIFLIITSVLNVGLDLFFIIVFDAGVLGAAVATDLSQAVSGIISLIYLLKKFDIIKMQPGENRLHSGACAKLLGMGLPMGLQCSITAIGSIIMQWAVNVLGSTAVAAVTAAGKTSNLLCVPLESIGTAMTTYAGQNLGAARLDRVRSGVRCAMGIITVYAAGSLLFLHFFDVGIIGMFIDTGTELEVVSMAQSYLFWNSVFYLPLGALIVWRYDIQGLGYSSIAMLAGVAEMIARTAVALLLVPALGYFGASLANPAAWIAACIFLAPAYSWTMHHIANRLNAGKLRMSQEI